MAATAVRISQGEAKDTPCLVPSPFLEFKNLIERIGRLFDHDTSRTTDNKVVEVSSVARQ